ncbi:MAG: hypothetical protein ACLU4N_12975 [Butyricimonas faecihominis]
MSFRTQFPLAFFPNQVDQCVTAFSNGWGCAVTFSLSSPIICRAVPSLSKAAASAKSDKPLMCGRGNLLHAASLV